MTFSLPLSERDPGHSRNQEQVVSKLANERNLMMERKPTLPVTTRSTAAACTQNKCSPQRSWSPERGPPGSNLPPNSSPLPPFFLPLTSSLFLSLSSDPVQFLLPRHKNLEILVGRCWHGPIVNSQRVWASAGMKELITKRKIWRSGTSIGRCVE